MNEGKKNLEQFPTYKAGILSLYQVAAQHWAHAEQIRWTLLYNYLMASTLLLLAWATVFTCSQPWRQPVLIALAGTGVAVSGVWVALGARASSFVTMYTDLGRSIESVTQNKCSLSNNLIGPFSAANVHRHNIGGIARLAPSWLVLLVIPGQFVILYFGLVLVSIFSA